MVPFLHTPWKWYFYKSSRFTLYPQVACDILPQIKISREKASAPKSHCKCRQTSSQASTFLCTPDSCPPSGSCGTLHYPVGKNSQNTQWRPTAMVCHGRCRAGGKPVQGKQAHEAPELQLLHRLLQGQMSIVTELTYSNTSSH